MNSREKLIVDTYNRIRSVKGTMKECKCANRTVKKALATDRAERAFEVCLDQYERDYFTNWELLFIAVSLLAIWWVIYLIINFI